MKMKKDMKVNVERERRTCNLCKKRKMLDKIHIS